METTNFVDKLASQLGQSATVKNVYGEPIVAGDKTIIPVAQIAYGLGGGYGHGKNKMKPSAQFSESNKDNSSGEGAGGGGGMYARPAGVYEVTARRTRFIPASPARILLAGLVAGFVVHRLLFGRRK
jgi:uncharacterized spore protein YtfJ